MKPIELMDDRRHGQLIKAAEQCIDLMNIGIDPNAALRKVAKDNGMTDKEVYLVSHAVNNSKQLAHLQTAKAEDKEKPFPLTNAEEALGAASPAQLDTISEHSEQDAEQPDAIGIIQNLKKDAAAHTYEDRGSYRRVEVSDEEKAEKVASLREDWGVTKTATADGDFVNPYDSLSEAKFAISRMSEEAMQFRDAACDVLDKIASAFCVSDGPSFAEFEKAAGTNGITQELIDLIYDLGPAGLEQARAQEKTASGRMFVSPEVYKLVKSAENADELWQASADREAVKAHLQKIVRSEEAKIAGILPEELEGLESIDEAVGDAKSKAEGAGGFLGLGENPVESISQVSHVPSTVKSEPAKIDDLGHSTRQQILNSSARSKIENLLQDPYVGKHEIPEVIDAYNQAMSVNPGFGDAEVLAYARQHLGSRGAVPLDLMIRAAGSHKPVKGE